MFYAFFDAPRVNVLTKIPYFFVHPRMINDKEEREKKEEREERKQRKDKKEKREKMKRSNRGIS